LERFAPDQINEDVIRPSLTSDREGLPQVHRLNSLLVAIPRYLTKLCFFALHQSWWKNRSTEFSWVGNSIASTHATAGQCDWLYASSEKRL